MTVGKIASPRQSGQAGAAPSARQVAVDALVRIDSGGAFAHLVVPPALAASDLPRRDRAFVTELVYGVTRRRRALDWVIDAFLVSPPPPSARAALRLGAYQLLELGTPAHAAVSATVDAAPRRFRGLVNAVLRRMARTAAEAGTSRKTGPDAEWPAWPDAATRLSYPDWIVERLFSDLGAADALACLEAMNGPAPVHRRADGYRQDLSSQLVVDAVGVAPGDLVGDLCAAPGGKATALAARGAVVVAVDSHRGRARRLSRTAAALGAGATLAAVAAGRRLAAGRPAGSAGNPQGATLVAVADGRRPPFRPGSFHTVLVDAPCSGLGALRRRPDARWRIEPDAVPRLACLQRDLLTAAAPLLRPGGLLVYSVCTLTRAETVAVAEHVTDRGGLQPLGPPPAPWRPLGAGGILLPDTDLDGMAMFAWRRP